MPFRLCVYDPAEDVDAYPPNSMMGVEDYLHSPPPWKADLYEIIVLFDALPMDVVDDMNTFGVLHHILPQLQEAQARLSQNKFALLRTVGEHTAVFFILRPLENKVLFSTYNKFPTDYLAYFPLKDSPMFFSDRRDQQALLYDFVAQDHDDHHPVNTEFAILEHIKDVEMDLNALLVSLEHEAALGYRLIDFESSRQ
jgi:hypothetical protein